MSNNNLMLRLLQVPAGPQGQAEAVAYLGFLFPLTQLLRQAQTFERKRRRLKSRSNASVPCGLSRDSPRFPLSRQLLLASKGNLNCAGGGETMGAPPFIALAASELTHSCPR